VPVTPDYQGFAMIGGTNPVAAILESGRSAEVQSMKGLIDISKINYLSDY
jgi:repressor of nif and glnA expression